MKISLPAALLGLSFLVTVSAQDSATPAGCQTCARTPGSASAPGGKPAALRMEKSLAAARKALEESAGTARIGERGAKMNFRGQLHGAGGPF